jgi:hypothetical protein
MKEYPENNTSWSRLRDGHFGMETALREAFKVENYSANSHQISFVWKHDQLQVYQQHFCGFRASERNSLKICSYVKSSHRKCTERMVVILWNKFLSAKTWKIYRYKLDLRFSQRCLWRVPSTGMNHIVVQKKFHRVFRGTYSFHFHGRRLNQARNT